MWGCLTRLRVCVWRPGGISRVARERVPSGPLLRPAGLREALSVAHSDFSFEFGFLEPFAGRKVILLRIWPMALYIWLYRLVSGQFPYETVNKREIWGLVSLLPRAW